MNYKIGANCSLTLAPHFQKAQSKSMFTAFTFILLCFKLQCQVQSAFALCTLQKS